MHAGPGVPDRTAAIGRPTAAVDGVDMAAGGRVEGADDDVVADGAEREPRDEGYPDAGGDEALHGEVVVDVEGDVGGEAGGGACVGEGVGVGVAGAAGGDPGVGYQVREPDDVPVCQRVAGGRTTWNGSSSRRTRCRSRSWRVAVVAGRGRRRGVGEGDGEVVGNTP